MGRRTYWSVYKFGGLNDYDTTRKDTEESREFGLFATVFFESAKFVLENQWISVKEDLPCNHEELINTRYNLTT